MVPVISNPSHGHTSFISHGRYLPDQLRGSYLQAESVQEQMQAIYTGAIRDICSDLNDHSINYGDVNVELKESDDSTLETDNELSQTIHTRKSRGKGSPSGVRR